MSNLFLRHGEVQNKKEVFYANLPGFYLSRNGEMQARDAAKKIKKLFNIQKIISSPLLRARQMARIVSEEIMVDVEFSHNIIEWSGPYEWIGKTIEEIKVTDSYNNYNNNPLNLMNTQETLKNVYERFRLDYEQFENTLFVSHQDTIRAFTYYYLEENDFTKNRPNHCELQSINSNNLISYSE